MVVQLSDGKVYVISSMEDIRDLIDPELYDAIEELTGNKYNTYESYVDDLKEDIDVLKDEINGYDNSCYSMRNAIFEAAECIERLSNYIKEAKRLDRDKLMKNLNSISENLENCEGY